MAGGVELLHGGVDVAIGAAPAHDDGVGVGIALHLEFGDVEGDVVHLLLAGAHHVLVVVGVVAQRAGGVVLLEATHAVL